MTLVICTIYGPVLKFHRVTRWYTEEARGVRYEQDGLWKFQPLERRHVGVYAS